MFHEVYMSYFIHSLVEYIYLRDSPFATRGALKLNDETNVRLVRRNSYAYLNIIMLEPYYVLHLRIF